MYSVFGNDEGALSHSEIADAIIDASIGLTFHVSINVSSPGDLEEGNSEVINDLKTRYLFFSGGFSGFRREDLGASEDFWNGVVGN